MDKKIQSIDDLSIYHKQHRVDRYIETTRANINEETHKLVAKYMRELQKDIAERKKKKDEEFIRKILEENRANNIDIILNE